MRISDWSSDVCSSDLAVGGLVDGHAIAFIQPAIKVAIAAATAAKRLVRLVARLGAEGAAAGPGGGVAGHGRPITSGHLPPPALAGRYSGPGRRTRRATPRSPPHRPAAELRARGRGRRPR